MLVFAARPLLLWLEHWCRAQFMQLADGMQALLEETHCLLVMPNSMLGLCHIFRSDGPAAHAGHPASSLRHIRCLLIGCLEVLQEFDKQPSSVCSEVLKFFHTFRSLQPWDKQPFQNAAVPCQAL